MKLLTSFTQLTTGEGERIAFTYSEVNEMGTIVNQNIKESFIILDKDLKISIDKIKDYIRTNKLSQVGEDNN